MSDFMKWLYANYIKPQIDLIPKGEYKTDFYLLEDKVEPYTVSCFGRAQEYIAVHAFLLGFETGKGLTKSLPDI